MKKILPLLFFIALLRAAEDPRPNGGQSMHKSSIQDWKFFDINSIFCTINSAGPYADYLRTNSSGLFWPKGTSKTAVYTSGIWIVGKHQPTGQLRTAVQHYSTEFQPGPINGTFNTSTNDISVVSDPVSPQHRIYKIKKGDESQWNPDYTEWPGELGAPYVDANGNGIWDKGIDTPKLSGDQTLWCVYNDGNLTWHFMSGKTMPLGIEVHAMYYGFNTSGPLNNTMFMQWKIINKSDAQYDSVFVGLFSDFDLGDGNDDIDGYDSTNQMAYVFNADNDDAGFSGYGSAPPACGTVFLGGNPELHPYAYPVWIKGMDGDPPLGNDFYSIAAYNYLRGLKKYTGEPNVNPVTNLPDKFAFTGDPVTNSGWTRLGSGYNSSDIRSLLSLGPITLAPGDTQVVHAAFVIARGNDRLESVIQLRESARLIKILHANNFAQPQEITIPAITADSVTLKIRVEGKYLNAKSIAISIESEWTDSVMLSTVLHDDGSFGDSASADMIFSKILTIPASPEPARINATIQDNNGIIWNWRELGSHIPLSRLAIADPIIYSDDINKDGKLNPGEAIRLGFSVLNQHPFPVRSVQFRTELSKNFSSIDFDTISANIKTVNQYNPLQYNTYISIVVPSDITEPSIAIPIRVSYADAVLWIDTVKMPVERTELRVTRPHHTLGRSGFNFDVIVTDRNALKNHTYVLRGIDSGSFYYGFQLKDSTDNTILIPVQPILYDRNDFTTNHQIPVIDGFKIKIAPMPIFPDIEHHIEQSESTGWLQLPSPYFFFDSWHEPSTVHFADMPKTVTKFSMRTGFTDVNANGICDHGEPYTFDQADSMRTQKAYLYTYAKRFLGFITIPFAVFDISSYPHRKLDIVLFRYDTLDSTLRWGNSRDNIIVMATTYSDNGVPYDSTKGGVNLLPALSGMQQMPFYYRFTARGQNGILSDTVNYFVDYTPHFSSRDVFTFNPTVIQIYEPNAPSTYLLFQNFPNPFNPSTLIRFSLPSRSSSTITIYDILGRRVRTLLNEVRDAGTYEIEWNGRDDSGIPVSSGLYLYRFSNEGTNIVKKMMLLK
jgi:hypothetical protein